MEWYAAVIIVVVIAAALIIQVCLSTEMGSIAASKGHDENRYSKLCFWLGILGCLVVLGLKDLNLEKQNEEIIRLLNNKINDSKNAVDSNSFESLV